MDLRKIKPEEFSSAGADMAPMESMLKSSGLDMDRAKLIAAWQKSHAKHGDRTRRVESFWHRILTDRSLHYAAAGMLDELLFRDWRETTLAKTNNSGGLNPNDTQNCGAPAVVAERGTRCDVETQKFDAPSPTQRAASIYAAISIYDSYKLEDGTSIGDVKWVEIPRLKARYVRHASLLDQIYKYGKPDDVFASVRECVSMATLRVMIQNAAEVQDEKQ